MSWVALDDRFPDHPKIARLGELAASAGWLHVSALCYCNRWLTDGFIPSGKLSGLYVLKDHDPLDLAKALKRAGIWEKARGGWRIHDYEDYQPSRVMVEQKRVANHEARVRAGKARADCAGRGAGGVFVPSGAGQDQHTRGAGDYAGPAQPAAHQQPTSTATSSPPAPSPYPLTPRDKTPVSSGSTDLTVKSAGVIHRQKAAPLTWQQREVFAGKLGHDLTRDEASTIARFLAEHDQPSVVAAIEEAREKGADSVMGYARRCLETWGANAAVSR